MGGLCSDLAMPFRPSLVRVATLVEPKKEPASEPGKLDLPLSSYRNVRPKALGPIDSVENGTPVPCKQAG